MVEETGRFDYGDSELSRQAKKTGSRTTKRGDTVAVAVQIVTEQVRSSEGGYPRSVLAGIQKYSRWSAWVLIGFSHNGAFYYRPRCP